MSNLSSKIRKEAKSLSKKDKSKKLTLLQNELAQQHGFSSFKALIQHEKQEETQRRLDFAKSGNSQSSEHVYPTMDDVEVFIRDDGLRGLRALRTFDGGEIIFEDNTLVSVKLSDFPIAKKIGMPWVLTIYILLDRPEFISVMEDELKFRPSNIPKLDQIDKLMIEELKQKPDISEEKILKVYNLVCTYNLRTEAIISLPVPWVNQACIIALGLSYANHSCDPNAERVTFSDRDDLFSTGMVAKRKISIGDEITWSYFGDCQHRGLKDRQKELKRDFGFDCRCYRCFQERFKLNKH
ncbi:hypothetical protein CWO07_25080 [Vibrio splendidus]|uniref:SET domain-containing protein n=1 Tax=Vibrio splendidus TaxID=29497 RepID=A0A2T5EFW3_VIBSP|nr:SET domain-containing protein-lysine N-methyltransferase [Vibrio splendidus]PTP18322.1 hypothetical protein CWO07_25080 [Vibrio splendidus]